MARNARTGIPGVESAKRCSQKIAPAGLLKFAEMIEAQGGDPRVCFDTALLPKARRRIDVPAARDGYVSAIRTSDIGSAAKLLGAGRERKEDALDLSVGIVMKKRIGDPVRRGDAVLTLNAGERSDVVAAMTLVNRAISISEEPVKAPALIHAVVE